MNASPTLTPEKPALSMRALETQSETPSTVSPALSMHFINQMWCWQPKVQAQVEIPLNAMEAFRKEMLVDLSPSKEAALASKVKEMLRARGEHSNTVMVTLLCLHNFIPNTQ